MTLEQLRIFVAVAEREHVTKAAGDLNLTQSAVSAAVSALENRYATKLFDRVGRRIELTEAGRTFLSEARAVLARARAAETVLADLAGLKRGSLTLAASQTVANYWLPALMHRYRGIYPGIELRLIIGNTEAVASMPAAHLAAAVVVVPSTEPEAFGRVTVEAQAMGTPVVVTDLGAASETVLAPPEVEASGRTGWRVPPHDARALADVIGEALNYGASARDMLAFRSRTFVQTYFSVDRMCSETLAAYVALLAQRV